MRVVGQDVPSDLFSDYCKSLTPSFQKWSNRFNTFLFNQRRFGTGPDIYYARKRSPFRIPHMQDSSLFCPSAGQIEVRRAFRRVLNGYNQLEKYMDHIDEYGVGPPSRSDWYYWAKGQPLWYMNYLISILWWYCYNFKPAALQRYNLFDDTYCSWGRYGNESENYSTEPELIAGVHVNSSAAIDSGWLIYISKSVRTYANTLSTLYLKAVNPQYGIQVWRTTLPAGDASTMTFMTAPSLFKVVGEYSVDYLNSGKLIPIFDESKNPDFKSKLYDCVAISPIWPGGWPPHAEGFHGVTFHSREFKGATHASICP